MTNPGKAPAVIKKILKWFLIILGSITAIPLLYFVVTLLTTGSATKPFPPAPDAPPEAKEQFAVMGFSPDSKKLYLEFVDTSHHLRIGWMDLATKQVSLFAPQNTQDELASPSSSADGREMAIVIKSAASNYEKSQIGVLDLKSNIYRAITKSDSYKQFPSFSQDGKKIIYAQPDHKRESGKTRFAGWDIYETDVITGVERRLTDFHFSQIDPPHYYLEGGKQFVFSGDAPRYSNSQHSHGAHAEADEDYKDVQRVRDTYKQQYQDNIIFMMSDSEKTLKPLFLNGKYSSAPFVTRNGTIFFVSRTNEMDGIKCCSYNFDIFVYEGGAIKRLTNLKTYLSGLVASPMVELTG